MIRLVLMAHHYRADWEWSQSEVDRAVERLRDYREAAALGGAHPRVVAALRQALRSDLDTPAALGVLDAWARTVRTADADLEPSAEDGAAAESGAGAEGPGDVPAAVDALFGIDLTA